jgi:YcaO-like protein with predicted kinase domain
MGLTAPGYSQSIRLLNGAYDLPVTPDHDRHVEPRKTLQSLMPHFGILGITRLGELTGLDTLGIPVAFAVRPNSFTLSVNLGKGLDRESARASAAMEAAETAIAEKPPGQTIWASLKDLTSDGEAIVDLSHIARCHPHRLPPSQKIRWTESRNIVSGARVLVPWALVGFDHRLNNVEYHDAFEVTSDGLASGNSPAEAVLHGIYELIERDAYSVLEFLSEEEVLQRLCQLGSIADPRINHLIDAISRAGLAIFLLDMTSDISVPAYTALLVPTSPNPNDESPLRSVHAGCGCHLFRERAIIRALTEAAQSRLAFIAGARDDFQARHYGLANGLPASTYRNFLDRTATGTGSAQKGTRRSHTDTIGEAIEELITQLAAAGIHQVLAVEFTAADWDVSVVRVLIPDLQVPLHGMRTQICRRGLRQVLRVVS